MDCKRLFWCFAAAAALLAGCSTTRDGGYYQNDGPPASGHISTRSAVPRVESFRQATLRPYWVMGRRYSPETRDVPMRERGIGSWYGKQFHGKKTAIGETYNMYEASAAHPTMPLPSYARVTNLENGRSIIVRVNDRGPFLYDRVIDLSYGAAKEIGYAGRGTARVEVVRLTNRDIASGAWRTGASPERTEPEPRREAVPPQAARSYSVAAPSPGWAVQIGVFQDPLNAERYAAHAEALLSSSGQNVPVRILKDQGRCRVLVEQSLPHERASLRAREIGSLLGCSAFAIEK